MPLSRTLRYVASHPLNRGRELRSILRYLRWQVRSRTRSAPAIWDWVNGTRLLVRAGETGVTGNVYCGLHEFEDMAFLLHFLRPGDLFADAGANAGSYTVLASAAVGARCVSFEPGPETYDRLLANVRLNAAEDRVTCHRVALGAATGTARFCARGDTTGHVLVPGEHEPLAIEVEMRTLDDALRPGPPALLKIDVEGHEGPVLEGGAQTLRDPGLLALIVEISADPAGDGGTGDLCSRLADAGFSTHAYDPFRRSVTLDPGPRTGTGNTLFLRTQALDRIVERLRSAPRFRVLGRSL